MGLKATILGCGSSGGVPRLGGHWGACDPSEPKNRRTRCSLLLEKSQANEAAATTVLIDTSPDLREQLLAAGVSRVDGVVYSHDHADQTHGIDDLRPLVFANQRMADLYMDEATRKGLMRKFDYIFETPPGSDYPPIARALPIEAGERVQIGGPGGEIALMPFMQYHGRIHSLGFRVGGLGYANDLVGLPEESYAYLEDLEVLIVDALRYSSHPTHFNLQQALDLIERVKPERAVLTNMHIDLDYRRLCEELPAGVVPAYDGMGLELTLD